MLAKLKNKSGLAKAKVWKSLSLDERLNSEHGMYYNSEHGINHPDGTMREAATRINELNNALYDILDGTGAMSKPHELVGFGISEETVKEYIELVKAG